jgi:hypothetical protein
MRRNFFVFYAMNPSIHPEESPHSQNNAFNKNIARHNQLRPDLGFFTLKDRTLNFSCLVAPTNKSLFEVMKLQANSITPSSSDHHCSSTNLGFHDLLCQLHGKKTSSMKLTACRAPKRSL